MNKRVTSDNAHLSAVNQLPRLFGLQAAALSGSRRERVYFKAKQYFDFCQWVILSTAFAGISLYFLNRPVNTLQYAACVFSTLTVTIFAFWHLTQVLHVNVAAAVTKLVPSRKSAASFGTVLVIALALDALILTGFIHMLHIFSSNLLARMDIVVN